MFSMHSPFSDRVLKQFFENRSNLLKDNLEGILMENEGDNLTELGNLLWEAH